jgi:hypothetical protein
MCIFSTDFCTHNKIPFYSAGRNLSENSPNVFLYGTDKIIRIANLVFYMKVGLTFALLFACTPM